MPGRRSGRGETAPHPPPSSDLDLWISGAGRATESSLEALEALTSLMSMLGWCCEAAGDVSFRSIEPEWECAKLDTREALEEPGRGERGARCPTHAMSSNTIASRACWASRYCSFARFRVSYHVLKTLSSETTGTSTYKLTYARG